MKKIPLLLALLFVALVRPVLAQTPKPPLESPKVRLAVGGKNSLFYLPLTVTEKLGYFKDEGLEVEFFDLGGGSKALQALVGGSADVTSGGYEHTIQMRAKGVPITAFVVQGAHTDIAIGIIKGKIPDYRSPKDLKGKKIGVSSPGSSTHLTLNTLLAREGLKPEDVSVIGVGLTGAAVAAARSGDLDAISNTDPVMTILEAAGDVKIIADARTTEGSKAIFGGDYVAASLYTTEDYIRKNPRTVQALTNAMVRGLKWIQTASNADVAKLVPELSGGEPAIFETAIAKVRPTLSPDGRLPAGASEIGFATLALFDPQVKEMKIDLAKTFDDRFVNEALKQAK